MNRQRKVDCDLFGNGVVIIQCWNDDIPNCWVRFWTKFFLNTKWTFYTEAN